MKLYYTVRELSTSATELWALRSLGGEVLVLMLILISRLLMMHIHHTCASITMHDIMLCSLGRKLAASSRRLLSALTKESAAPFTRHQLIRVSSIQPLPHDHLLITS